MTLAGVPKDHPDYHAIRSRAFGFLIGKGGARLTHAEIDKALEAGKAELRYERLMAARAQEEAG